MVGTPTLLRARTCDGQGGCVDRGTLDCTPYYCSSAACPTACTGASFCVAPNTCMNSTCGLHRAQGQACSTGSDCESTFCADGVCCDATCNATCKRCDKAGQVGTCVTAVGENPRASCPGDGTCVGTCAANATCSYPGADHACDVCKACNGAGKCNQLPASK